MFKKERIGAQLHSTCGSNKGPETLKTRVDEQGECIGSNSLCASLQVIFAVTVRSFVRGPAENEEKTKLERHNCKYTVLLRYILFRFVFMCFFLYFVF